MYYVGIVAIFPRGAGRGGIFAVGQRVNERGSGDRDWGPEWALKITAFVTWAGISSFS